MNKFRSRNFNRNVSIAKRAVSGATYNECAYQAGLSVERIRQIVKNVLRKSLRCSDINACAPCDITSILEIRKHSEYWLNAIDLMAEGRCVGAKKQC